MPRGHPPPDPEPVMRRAAPILLLGVLAIAVTAWQIGTIDRTPFFGDESHWIVSSAAWFHLFHGTPHEPFWIDAFDQPMFVPYVFGAIAARQGLDELHLNPPYDFRRDYETNVREGRIPDAALLYRCRLASTLFGVGGCLAGAAIAWRLAGPWAAAAALLLVGLNPFYLRSIHRAMAEGFLAFWFLSGWLLCVLAVEAWVRVRFTRGLLLSIAVGVVGGLGAMTKLTAGIILLNAAVCALVAVHLRLRAEAAARNPFSRDTGEGDASGIVARRRVRRTWTLPLMQVAVALAVGYLVFIVQSPVTWREPLTGAQGLAMERRLIAADQQVEHASEALRTPGQRVSRFVTRVGADLGPLASIAGSARVLWPDGLLTLAGLACLPGLRRAERSSQRGDTLVAVVWFVLLTLPFMAIVPLDWERYFFPAVLAFSVMEAAALGTLAERVQHASFVRRPPVGAPPALSPPG